jgi:hypothetical protein
MLTRTDLISLYRKYRNQKVLSIYLDADEHDPAKRRAWRRTLDHVLDQAGEMVGNDPAERASFEQAVAHLKKELRKYDAFLPDRGWAGFAIPDSLLYGETLPVAMPDLACWEDGLRAAPYVRALKQAVPVITVLVDSRRARLFQYRQGVFDELPALQADAFAGDLSDVNMSKRAATHSGVRGVTETDVSQRIEEVAADRLLKDLVDAVRGYAETDCTVVVGGPPETLAQATQRLRKVLNGRLIEDPSLNFRMSQAELKRATELAASAATSRRQKTLVDQVAELAGAGGRGSLGREATQRALEERRVEVLLLSRQLATREPVFADHCVGAALDQDADVEEFGGDPGEQLEKAGMGIGARLRFTT